MHVQVWKVPPHPSGSRPSALDMAELHQISGLAQPVCVVCVHKGQEAESERVGERERARERDHTGAARLEASFARLAELYLCVSVYEYVCERVSESGSLQLMYQV